MPAPELLVRRWRGLRTNSTKFEKSKDELSQADNVYFDRERVLSARQGIRKVLTEDSGLGLTTPNYIVSTFVNAAGERKLVATCLAGLWISDGVNNFVKQGVLDPGVNAHQGVFYDGKLYFSSGKYYDGTVAAAVTGSPTDRNIIRLHKDRIWITSSGYTISSTLGYRVYFSKPGASVTTGWSATDFIDVKLGGTIKSIESYRDSIYVLKSDSVWVINTGGLPENWTLRKLTDNGCLSGATVYNEVLYWVGPTGFFSYNGVQVSRLSDPIQEFFDSHEFAFVAKTQVIGFEGNLYVIFWTLEGGVEVKNFYIYNIDLKAWTRVVADPVFMENLGRGFSIESKLGVDPTKDLIPSGIWFADNPSTAYQRTLKSYYFMSPDVGIYADKDYAGTEKPYIITVETAALDFDNPTFKKRLKVGMIEMQGNQVIVTQKDEEGKIKVKELSGNDPNKVSYLRFPGIGFFRKVIFTFVSNDFDDGFKLYSLMGAVQERGKESNNSRGTYV